MRGGKRIKRAKQLPVERILHSLGYRVRTDAGNREQQYSCDLHGDGKDSKFSARVYPQSNSVYCFACNQIRDPISLIRDKKGLRFWEAVQYLEQAYDLPRLAYDGADYEKKISLDQEIQRIFKVSPLSIEKHFHKLKTILSFAGKEHLFDLTQMLPLWEYFDKIEYCYEQKKFSKEKTMEVLSLLQEKIFLLLKENENALIQ